MPTMINPALLDLDGLTEATAGQTDASGDFVPILDQSGSVVKKVKPNNLGIGEVAGVIKMYGGSTAPNGYLLCDGSEVNRTTYATLFAAIGTTYGVGNGTTTFNLPDLRGRVPGGVNNAGLPNGANGSFSTRNEAEATGAETHTLSIAEMPSHSHSYTNCFGSGGANWMSNGDGDKTATSKSTGSAGSNAGHNNMRPTLFCHFIIATGD